MIRSGGSPEPNEPFSITVKPACSSKMWAAPEQLEIIAFISLTTEAVVPDQFEKTEGLSWVDHCDYKPDITIVGDLSRFNFYSIISNLDDNNWANH